MGLIRTALYDRHLALRAKMTEFHGWEMPLYYSSILEEHIAVREALGVFDISHMGQVLVTGRGALKTLDRLTVSEIGQMGEGRACYTMLLNEAGDDSCELVAAAFEPVHQAAMRSALSVRAWRWLAPRMPPSNWYSLYDWDRAEKLRRALVDSFIRHRWDPNALHRAATDRETRRRLASYCRTSREGRRLLLDARGSK